MGPLNPRLLPLTLTGDGICRTLSSEKKGSAALKIVFLGGFRLAEYRRLT